MKTLRGQAIRPSGRVTVASMIDAALAASLQREAADQGVTVSELLRRLILELVHPEEGKQHRDS